MSESCMLHLEIERKPDHTELHITAPELEAIFKDWSKNDIRKLRMEDVPGSPSMAGLEYYRFDAPTVLGRGGSMFSAGLQQAWFGFMHPPFHNGFNMTYLTFVGIGQPDGLRIKTSVPLSKVILANAIRTCQTLGSELLTEFSRPLKGVLKIYAKDLPLVPLEKVEPKTIDR